MMSSYKTLPALLEIPFWTDDLLQERSVPPVSHRVLGPQLIECPVCFFTLHFYTEKREGIRRNWGLTNIFLFLRSEDEKVGQEVEEGVTQWLRVCFSRSRP